MNLKSILLQKENGQATVKDCFTNRVNVCIERVDNSPQPSTASKNKSILSLEPRYLFLKSTEYKENLLGSFPDNEERKEPEALSLLHLQQTVVKTLPQGYPKKKASNLK